MIKALLIDVDGVLIDGRPLDGLNWAHDLEKDLGIRRDDLVASFFAPYWDDIVCGRDGILGPLTSTLGEIAPHADAQALLDYWFSHDARINGALLDQLSLFRQKNGLPCYLATNQEHLRAAYIMNDLALGAHTDGIFYSAAMGCRKPDLDFYKSIQSALNLAPENLLLIDDTKENLEAASRLGWQSLHWTKGSSVGDISSLIASATQRA
ncbi:HAD-IA family hydrolase [Pelagibacterium sp.]|uniref:HAD-IA family hydrolase n=1 Tax=Pelagibacterium sp. TaxID=1967288 RepID=UPI003A904202